MRILIYGDSNTWGHDPQTGLRLENRYTKLLQKWMPEHEFIEEGLVARTLCQEDPFDENRNGKKFISMVVKSHEPLDKIWIQLGTNDAKRIFNTNLYSMEKGLKSVLNIIQNPNLYTTYKKVPEIWIIRPVRMHPDYKYNEKTNANFGKEGYEILENVGKVFSKLCRERNVLFIDTKDICMADPIDGIHMNETNHYNLAVYLKMLLEAEK